MSLWVRGSIWRLPTDAPGGPRWRFLLASRFLMIASLGFLASCGGGSTTPSGLSAPVVTISAANLDFGAWRVSTTSTALSVTFTNSGSGVLTISGITIGGTNPGAYALSQNNCGASLSPGSNCAMNVTFSPSSSASYSASLTITDNAGNGPQTVGLSGSGFTVGSLGQAHGMFMLDPPTGDGICATAGYPPNCYTQHLVPTMICTGTDTPAGYGCSKAGAGEPYLKGAAFHVAWDTLNPSNGTYDFTQVDKFIQPWSDSGKLVSFVIEPTSFGTTNDVTPAWYLAPVNISNLSQTGGIITVQTAAGFGFLPGVLSSAAGLEIQIAGTGTLLDGDGTPANPGIWVVCDHNTSGCQDPSAQTIYAVGPGGSTTAVAGGTVGNPVYGSACASGILPIQWGPNFIKAWQQVIAQVVQHYGSNTNVSYLRFGMGVGGQTNPTYGLADSDPTQAACQAQMTTYGFTTVTPPWPQPGASGWSQVSQVWLSFLQSMIQYEKLLNSPHPIMITTSGIQFGPSDLSTPDATASYTATDGIGFGNQGLQQNDPINFAAGKPCSGGDWCANFQKYEGQNPPLLLELQTLSLSSPTNVAPTGSLANLLPFATGLNARVLEIYVDDWMCTYDSSWSGNNTYSACTTAGYPAAFNAAAGQIN